jgi:hypothetical protein
MILLERETDRRQIRSTLARLFPLPLGSYDPVIHPCEDDRKDGDQNAPRAKRTHSPDATARYRTKLLDRTAHVPPLW